MLDQCTASCGWLAAIISCISFGSFAVPIKSNECQRINVDPLVFQSYKTAMCFFTSLLLLPLGQDFYYTPWGIISGLFWVPAGIAAIYAVKHAGLAVSQGLWSSIIVMVSFTWGIFIFRERVKSISGAIFAVLFMICGLWGMSYYSSPSAGTQPSQYEQVHSFGSLVDILPPGGDNNNGNIDGKRDGNIQIYNHADFENYSNSSDHISLSATQRTKSNSFDHRNYDVVQSPPSNSYGDALYYDGMSTSLSPSADDNHDLDLSYHSSSMSQSESIGSKVLKVPSNLDLKKSKTNESQSRNIHDTDDDHLTNPSIDHPMQRKSYSCGRCGRRRNTLSLRQKGLLAAVFNGIWGGSIMVPMHYAPNNVGGLGYVISFSLGATIITILLWTGRFGYYYFYQKMSIREAYYALPQFHISIMWRPGGIAGLLWSIGNMSSMISVQHLGEGVGYSLTQASMLVSGVWGIYYFREVQSTGLRIKWFLSALVTVIGILLLSYEHVGEDD
mmetsp:Transcript_27961/g.32040  ORF Transcript_27961/g.32040 Transcript_27961/m.32040 type:complete len:500 (+) Transcript_27961:117-1616(+)